VGEYGLDKFFTLTLDRERMDKRVDPWDYIHDPWSKFRKRMHRRYRGFKFVAVLESHKNKAYPHIHGFTNIWMSQKDWSAKWDGVGGGRIVWVEKVRDESVSTYVSKQLEVAKYVGKENVLGGYKEKGIHRTLWRSKNLKAKFELTSLEEYVMIKEHVFDNNGVLTDFYTKKGVWSNDKDKRQGKKLATTCSPVPAKSIKDGF
jgi:hypothetical protein